VLTPVFHTNRARVLLALSAVAVVLIGEVVVTCGVGADSTASPVCADTDGSGTVNLTDGIQVLRAAAGLPSACSPGICDLNVDNAITVTDGILALRLAAGLPAQTSCPNAEAGAVLGRTVGILDVGVAVIPSALAAVGETALATSSLCPDGGSATQTATSVTFVECRDQNGDRITNGTATFMSQPGTSNTDVSFQEFSVQRLSTGETLTSSGTVHFAVQGSNVTGNGTITRVSTLRGGFTDTLTAVTAENVGGVVSLTGGTVATVVTAGTGGFAHVTRLDTSILGSQVAIVEVTFTDMTQEIEIFADDLGLCTPCQTNSDCTSPLVCVACSTNCTGTTHRCSVNSQTFGAQCVDGLF
jgi:hypothetical protein